MQPLSQAGRTSVPQLWLLHNDVLALDPTESTQALLPRFDEIWGRSSHADSSNGWRRLRLGAKRRGEEAAAQGAKEGVLSRCRLQNHVAAARELGRVLAQRQLGVVYGGARVGLMGALADAALSGGGHVIGVSRVGVSGIDAERPSRVSTRPTAWTVWLTPRRSAASTSSVVGGGFHSSRSTT
jgi:hypothetical protein